METRLKAVDNNNKKAKNQSEEVFFVTTLCIRRTSAIRNCTLKILPRKSLKFHTIYTEMNVTKNQENYKVTKLYQITTKKKKILSTINHK